MVNNHLCRYPRVFGDGTPECDNEGLSSAIAVSSSSIYLVCLPMPLPARIIIQHPDGPNLGPHSNSCWLDDGRGTAESYSSSAHLPTLPAKTDLLHKGHVRGGKLLIVSQSREHDAAAAPH